MRERKKCPVDRGKLMIALECCRKGACYACPYHEKSGGCEEQVTDALAYIGWLEEKLEGLGNCWRCWRRRFGATYVAKKIIRRRKKEETA